MSGKGFCAGIFAAGDGTRLKASFPGLIKPMVPVGGKPLVHWAVEQLRAAGCDDLTILFNSRGGTAAEYLRASFPGFKFEFITKDTPTSYESFRLVSRTLAAKAQDFLMTTVDALYDSARLAEFFASSRQSGAPAAFGVTDAINDDKPLWVDLNAKGTITSMGPQAVQKVWATNGVYYVTAAHADSLPEPGRYRALREFLSQSVADGARYHSFPISAGADVDDPGDIKLAEEFLLSRGLCGAKTT